MIGKEKANAIWRTIMEGNPGTDRPGHSAAAGLVRATRASSTVIDGHHDLSGNNIRQSIPHQLALQHLNQSLL